MKKLILLTFFSLLLVAGEYKLAIEWFPSVCKVKDFKACKRDYPFWRENFTLHGLWPKKVYCKVSQREKILDKKGKWEKLNVKLPPKLAIMVAMYMPGYLSSLHKHEWIKHGTCYGKDIQSYFLDSITLVSQINNSKVKDFFIKNRGKLVQTAKIRKIFEDEFGNGKNVKFICEDGYLTEIRINLKGEISPVAPLYDLMVHAKPQKIGCKKGKIAR